MPHEYKGPYYVVAVDSQPGIYPSYKEALRYLDGYSKNDIKKYETMAIAKAVFSQRSRSDYDPNKEFTWSYSRPVRRR
ncbi:viroplasmin family protein [Paraglaciecola chathamensis]|uniref:Ribonuclease H1 N-terminal domain-containing protein n=1 Tax=Paraglaciecola chathamensis TaxID=368405 RepID=A0A8H9M2B4_9ALTE|nr:viroplasmin family protein [Paraglaciecola oceanifecundans]GGZ51386.1 hypothetical protein GCM10011274_06600 [Paraglaciecola oceanifecundans]